MKQISTTKIASFVLGVTLLVLVNSNDVRAISGPVAESEGGGGTTCLSDYDNDGICRGYDNCQTIYNPTQLNTDGDSYGNACDSDDDNDAVVDASDCAAIDAAQWRTSSVYPDSDRDGIADSSTSITSPCYGSTLPAGYILTVSTIDNCLGHYNPAQEDADNDGIGNFCDNDEAPGSGYLRVLTGSNFRQTLTFGGSVGQQSATAEGSGADEGAGATAAFVTNPFEGVLVQVIGKEITYGPTGGPVPVQLDYHLNDDPYTVITWGANNSVYLNAGDSKFIDLGGVLNPTLEFRGRPAAGILSESEGNEAIIFIEGDNINDMYQMRGVDPSQQYGGQIPLSDFLAPYVDAGTGEQLVHFDPNHTGQALILFELGTAYRPSPAFDMQDVVLLITPANDFDNDGVADFQDSCVDSDADGFGDPGVSGNTCAVDNCEGTANPDQLDTDADDAGNACDEDDDNDGILDCADNCPVVGNPTQIDYNFNNVGDECEAAATLAQTVSSTVTAGTFTQQVQTAITIGPDSGTLSNISSIQLDLRNTLGMRATSLTPVPVITWNNLEPRCSANNPTVTNECWNVGQSAPLVFQAFWVPGVNNAGGLDLSGATEIAVVEFGAYLNAEVNICGSNASSSGSGTQIQLGGGGVPVQTLKLGSGINNSSSADGCTWEIGNVNRITSEGSVAGGGMGPAIVIDARQPHQPGNPSAAQSWQYYDLVFEDGTSGMTADQFEISEIGGDGVAPTVSSVEELGGSHLRVHFNYTQQLPGGGTAPIVPEVGTWLKLTHLPSSTSAHLGILPCDVNQDGKVTTVGHYDTFGGFVPESVYIPGDLEYFETYCQSGGCSLEQGDIDRNGSINPYLVNPPSDIGRLLLMFSGNGFDSCFGKSLPPLE